VDGPITISCALIVDGEIEGEICEEEITTVPMTGECLEAYATGIDISLPSITIISGDIIIQT
jgi:hypothetical protein